jgi:hypothetical protein
MSDLDRCSRCSSVHLVKRLGEVECRDCGAIVPPEGSGATDFAETLGEEPGGAGPVVAGRGPDLSEEVARALDRVLSRSLVSQSIQRAPDPEGKAGPGAGSGSGAGVAGAGAGQHRPARTAAGHHAAAHPGAERHRAARPAIARRGDDRLDEVRPGAFAG